MNGVNYNLLNDQVEWLLQYSRFILIKIESKREQYWKNTNAILIMPLKSSLTKKMFRYLIIVYSFIKVYIVGTHEMHILIKPGIKKETRWVEYFTNSIVMQITLTTCKSRCMFVSLWKILFYIWPRMRYLFCLKNVWLDRSVFIYVQFSSILD